MNRRQALKAWIGGLFGVAAAPVVAKAVAEGGVSCRQSVAREHSLHSVAAFERHNVGGHAA